jgi:Bifunctional DNA primase/polymerase, N-terminal
VSANVGNTHENVNLAIDIARLIENGYGPIPVNGKAPVEQGWQEGAPSLERFTARLDATNVGLRTGRLSATDIDLENSDHAAQLQALVFEVLGETDLVRFGRKGALLCYRNETPIGKITIKGAAPGDKVRNLIEILGAGQQFVAYGVHPDTGQPYRWQHPDFAGDPLDWPLAQLCAVTPQQLRDFARKARETLTALGYQDVRVSGSGFDPERKEASPAKGQPVTDGQLIERLAYLDPDCDRDTWRNRVAEIRATPLKDDPDESNRLEIACRWPRGELDRKGRGVPAKYTGDEDVRKVFDTMPPGHGRNGGVGFGSIDHAAREAGFNGPRAQPPGSEVFKDSSAQRDGGTDTVFTASKP